MEVRLIVFDSHPVQYRAPVWKDIEEFLPNVLHVVYASDCSTRGFEDKGFGKTFAWDEPLLEGYSYTVLNSENGVPLSSWNSLTGKGVWGILSQYKPQAVVLTGLNYRYDLTVLLYSKIHGASIWLRCETQDFAFNRSKLKTLIRKVIYKFLYSFIDIFFYIGELNKKHYLNHGVKETQLFPARYCTVDRLKNISVSDKQKLRNEFRKKNSISEADIVIGFSGKFITKKNPKILFEMLTYLPNIILKKVVLYFIGSGDLEEELINEAKNIENKYGIKSVFTGFINQTQIGYHYLAIDIFVLPSKRMGETWGLVVNEALQAGCNIVVSEAVGCGNDFEQLERFMVFEEDNAKELANRICLLTSFDRSFDWTQETLKKYSIESVTKSIISQLKNILKSL